MIKVIVFLLLLTTSANANLLASNVECNNEKTVSLFINYFSKKIETFQNVKDFRSVKLLLKNAYNFQENTQFENKDNKPLADFLIMEKINNGLKDYKICQNNKHYLLIYKNNDQINAKIFDENKEILSTIVK